MFFFQKKHVTEMSNAAEKAPSPAPRWIQKSMLSHGQLFLSGRATPPTHSFGSVHINIRSWGVTHTHTHTTVLGHYYYMKCSLKGTVQ